MPPPLPGPGSRPDQTLSLNMRLLAHHELQGFGGIGEGMAMQLARDGRRILWLAHESAPKNFTGVDVTDPRNAAGRRPDRAAAREGALELARRRRRYHGGRLPDAEPRHRSPRASTCSTSACRSSRSSSRTSTASGPHSRGVHALWFVDGEFVHMASRRAGLPTAQSERRPVLPHRRRAQSLAAGRGRPLVAAGHARRRQRAAAAAARSAGSTPAFARTTRMSFRSGRIAPTSVTSTAAR